MSEKAEELKDTAAETASNISESVMKTAHDAKEKTAEVASTVYSGIVHGAEIAG